MTASASINANPVERRRRQLLARIHRRFDTVTEDVRVAGGEEAGGLTLPFTRIADPNRVLDQVAEEEDRRDKLAGRRRDGEELHLPYWAELWDSSLAMIEVLAEEKTNGSNESDVTYSVLDLGCGMGLTGAVAAA